MGILIDLAKTSTGILRDAFANGAPSAERTLYNAVDALNKMMQSRISQSQLASPQNSGGDSYDERYFILHNAIWDELANRGWPLKGTYPAMQGTSEQVLFSCLLYVMRWAEGSEFGFRYALQEERSQQTQPRWALEFIHKQAPSLAMAARNLERHSIDDLQRSNKHIRQAGGRIPDQPEPGF